MNPMLSPYAAVVLAVAVVAIVFTVILLAPRTHRPSSARIVRRRVFCPPRGEEATVEFLVDADDGEVYREVVSCSLLESRDLVECDRVCRSSSVAPLGMRQIGGVGARA